VINGASESWSVCPQTDVAVMESASADRHQTDFSALATITLQDPFQIPIRSTSQGTTKAVAKADNAMASPEKAPIWLLT